MSKIDLYKGDCLEVMDELIAKGVVIDAIITDPPYGTTACKWDSIIPFDQMWERLNKLIKPNGAIVLFGSEPFSSALRMSNIKNYKYDWDWNKVSGGAFVLSKIRPLQTTENIMIFGKNKIKYYPIMEDAIKKNIRPLSKPTVSKEIVKVGGGVVKPSKDRDISKRFPKTLLQFNKNNKECNNTKRLHPTQKPVALMEYLIKTYTNENELVLDFTFGSGTTGVACKNLNRNFIGIELDDNYFNIASKRIEDANV